MLSAVHSEHSMTAAVRESLSHHVGLIFLKRIAECNIVVRVSDIVHTYGMIPENTGLTISLFSFQVRVRERPVVQVTTLQKVLSPKYNNHMDVMDQ